MKTYKLIQASSSGTERYISSIEHPFARRTSLFPHIETAEILYEEIFSFPKMKEVPRNKILLLETSNALHDVILARNVTEFVNEAKDASSTGA